MQFNNICCVSLAFLCYRGQTSVNAELKLMLAVGQITMWNVKWVICRAEPSLNDHPVLQLIHLLCFFSPNCVNRVSKKNELLMCSIHQLKWFFQHVCVFFSSFFSPRVAKNDLMHLFVILQREQIKPLTSKSKSSLTGWSASCQNAAGWLRFPLLLRCYSTWRMWQVNSSHRRSHFQDLRLHHPSVVLKETVQLLHNRVNWWLAGLLSVSP